MHVINNSKLIMGEYINGFLRGITNDISRKQLFIYDCILFHNDCQVSKMLIRDNKYRRSKAIL